MTIRLVLRGASFVVTVMSALATQGCGLLEYGTAATFIEITNTCSSPLRFRLTGERWDRSVADQIEGPLAEPGATVRETAIDPTDDEEQLVLRVSPPEEEPLLLVPITRRSVEQLTLEASACAAAGTDASCEATTVALEAAVSC